ncbi:MAG: AI-2E family transporter [Chloroflexi bacterium]|nr:AI-2E family transporter [Chloroflexota bacterium]
MATIIDSLKKHRHLTTVMAGVAAVFILLYFLRTVILPFVLGMVLAYLVLPLISWAERKLPYPDRWVYGKRVCLIVLIFIIVFGLLGIFSYYLFGAVINAFVTLVEHAPSFLSLTFFKAQQLLEGVRQGLPPEILNQWDRMLIDAGAVLGNRIREAFFSAISSLPSAFGIILGFGSLPLFLFYILKDSKSLSTSFYSGIPSWAVEHTRNIVAIIENVLGRYIRAQVLLGLIVAYFNFVGLVILGVGYAPALAAFSGVTELIPIIGPWIGGAVAVIVTMAINPEVAIWVAVLALVIQLLENNLLVPRIQGAYLRIHPAVAILLLVVGGYLWGFWGVLLVLPLTATFVEIYKYLQRTLQGDKTQ